MVSTLTKLHDLIKLCSYYQNYVSAKTVGLHKLSVSQVNYGMV